MYCAYIGDELWEMDKRPHTFVLNEPLCGGKISRRSGTVVVIIYTFIITPTIPSQAIELMRTKKYNLFTTMLAYFKGHPGNVLGEFLETIYNIGTKSG